MLDSDSDEADKTESHNVSVNDTFDSRLEDSRINDSRLEDSRMNDSRLEDSRINDSRLDDSRISVDSRIRARSSSRSSRSRSRSVSRYLNPKKLPKACMVKLNL